MLVLGINFGFHDPSAALLEDGRLLAMAEQERFSRRKRARLEMPIEAVRSCLRQAGARASDVAAIATGWDIERFEPALPAAPYLELDNALPAEFDRPLRAKTVPVAHHLSHAASALWSSGFDEAAIVVVDGQGERESSSIAYGDGDGIRTLASYPVNASLGHFYRAATQYAGLETANSRGEGKLMGLAAYGRAQEEMPLVTEGGGPAMAPELRVEHTANTRTEMREALLSWWRRTTFPYLDGQRAEQMVYANFAASAQAALEQALLDLARHARDATNSGRLVVAGGVAQNCSANSRIAASGLFDEYYFLPVAHDPGVSLGAALQVAHEHARTTGGAFTPTRVDHAYWGPGADDAQIAEALRADGLHTVRVPEAELIGHVATAMTEGRIVGWCSGRAEIGPRALGARSVLADPRSREIVSRLNRIKGREIWRPLAPSVLAERFDTYFDAPHRSPFMNVSALVRPEVRSRVPAIVHVDGTARPQTVDREHSPRYWSLIRRFEELTGVPVVLNTSFNLAGEPIVNSPADAVRTFLNSELDLLVLGPWLAAKDPSLLPGGPAGVVSRLAAGTGAGAGAEAEVDHASLGG
ncbi:carbamoyltransferase C-terminal domain-containing protein [Streptomyces varsoviensis]|uniref:carbamoyltransferase family protein n=1 Tax=Streptomyces varsoviensis TaxID=67373 RepID=UPI00340C861F